MSSDGDEGIGMPKPEEPGFEESLASLEAIVDQLERGELPLEQALSLFQDGVDLAGRCQRQLEQVQRKVEILTRERGEIKLVPFEPPRDPQNSEGVTMRPSVASKPNTPNGVELPDDDETGDDIPF
jgi:exodeoxyribonuclease VII small subunit